MLFFRQKHPKRSEPPRVRILEDGKLFGEEAEITFLYPLDNGRQIYYLRLVRGGTFQLIDLRSHPTKLEYLTFVS